MSAHADKTLHRKIYNIDVTNAFPPIFFLKNVMFEHEFVHKLFFVYEFMCEFVKEFFMNFITRIYARNWREFVQVFCTKNWLLGMACTVSLIRV